MIRQPGKSWLTFLADIRAAESAQAKAGVSYSFWFDEAATISPAAWLHLDYHRFNQKRELPMTLGPQYLREHAEWVRARFDQCDACREYDPEGDATCPQCPGFVRRVKLGEKITGLPNSPIWIDGGSWP